MKAHEARSIASELVAERRKKEEELLAPFLNDPEVDRAMSQVVIVVCKTIGNCPEHSFAREFAIPILEKGPKRSAFFKRLQNDGYRYETFNDETMIVGW